MPSLLTTPFPEFIRNIPILHHAVPVKAEAWKDKFEDNGQGRLWQTIFEGKIEGEIQLTRNRLLNHAYPKGHVQKCVEILLWGYPTNLHGVVTNALAKIEDIAKIVAGKSTPEWHTYFNLLDPQPGVGISTITKLAYFYKQKFGEHTALILDSRIISVIEEGYWDEIQVNGLTYTSAHNRYLDYLEVMHTAAGAIQCEPDQLEYFLFTLGSRFHAPLHKAISAL